MWTRVAWFVTAVLILVSYWLWPTATWALPVQNGVFLLAAFAPVIAGTAAVFSFGAGSTMGRAVSFITLALLTWCVGEYIWIYFELVGIDPFPSAADVYFLTGYPLLFIGLAMVFYYVALHRKRTFGAPQYFFLIVVGTILLIDVIYLVTFVVTSENVPWLENAIAISYGVGDMVLTISALMVLTVAWELHGGRLARPWFIFFIGIILTLVGDLLFTGFAAEYERRETVYLAMMDSIWIAGYLAMAQGLFLLHTIVQTVQKHAETLRRP